MWRLLRFLIGADVFISYARADAGVYADRLANRLKSEPGMSVYIDQELSPVGRELPAVLLRHLHLSRRLVLIMTDAALRSEALRREVDTFARTPRPVIPIDALATGKRPVWPGLAGAFWRTERPASVFAGSPSEAIVAEILEGVGADRQSARTRRAAWTALGSVVIAVIASAAMIVAARKEAVLQTSLAEATAMANEAQAMLGQDPRRLQHAALLSAAAMRRFDDASVRSLAADLAVRDALSQLGRIDRRIVFQQRADKVQVSRDGRFVAAAYDGTIELWNVQERSVQMLALNALCEAASDLKFSRDGSNLAAVCTHYGTSRSWVGVWRTSDGKSLGPPVVVRESSAVCALSSDGKFLAIESGRDVLTILSTAGDTAPRQLKSREYIVRLKFSPSSRYLMTSNSTFWDWQNSDVAMPPISGWRDVTFFSEDERFVVTDGNDNVSVFAFPSRKLMWSVEGESVAVDEKRLAIKRKGGGVDIFDLASGKVSTTLDMSYPNVVVLRGGEFGVGSRDGAGVFVLRNDRPQLSARVGHSEGVDDLVLLGDHTVVSAGADWALRWKSQLADVIWSDDSLSHGAFSTDSQQLVRDEPDEESSRIEIRDARTGKILYTASVEGYSISLAFGGKNRVAVGTSDGDVLLWEPGSGSPPRRLLPRSKDGIQAVQISGDGSAIAIASGNTVTMVSLDRQPAALMARIVHHGAVEKLAFGGADDEVVTACSDGRVRLWKVMDGAATLVSATKSVKFLPALAVVDGSFLAMAEGNAIAIRDLRRLDASPMELIDIDARATNIVAAAAGVFAAADEHGLLRVWRRDSATEEIARLEVPADEEPPVMLSPNGRWLVAVGRMAFEVRSLWPTDLLPALCGQLTPFADDPYYRAGCTSRVKRAG